MFYSTGQAANHVQSQNNYKTKSNVINLNKNTVKPQYLDLLYMDKN